MSMAEVDRSDGRGSSVGSLSATSVTVRFGGVTALSDVSIEVPGASITGLVGPNGAGKSTLFGVLSGLLHPQAGRVFFSGKEITRATPQQRANRGLARTFQQPELFSSLTVREHLVLAYRVRHAKRRLYTDLFTGRAWRRPDRDETETVDRLLEVLGLRLLANHPVLGLPLGTSRLVEIGRALAFGPSVLLLDEPTSGLDAVETEHLIDTFKRVADHGVALLLVEHDVQMVLALCSRVHVLDFGVIISSGTPEEIRHDPAVRAAYLGEEQSPEHKGVTQ